MARIDRAAYLLFAMEQLKVSGSWCGETHVQKALFLGQELLGLPTHFRYILYKHGPYSFELSEQLQTLISDELVSVQPRPPYGPSLSITDAAKPLSAKAESDPEFSKHIKFLARSLCKKTVSDLEKIATAEYLSKRSNKKSTLDILADELTEIKRHVTKEAAIAAFKEVEALRESAKKEFAA